MQSLNGKVWHDAIEEKGNQMSLDEKKDVLHNRLRTKLEKELQDQEITIEDYKLKYEIS